jgi:hypothetical protein
MADKPPTPQEDFINKINTIINTPIDDLIQNSKADQQKGVLIYNEIKPQVEELIGYLTELNLESVNDLPKARFNILHTKLSPIIAELNKIQETEKNPNQTDTAQKQPSVRFFNSTNPKGYFEEAKESIWQLIIETITLENRKSQDANLSKTKLKEIEVALKSAKESESKIKDILSSSRIELAKGGVSKHSDIFGNQADIHKTSANNWRENAIGLLIGNVILVILILVLVIWVVEDMEQF